LREFREEMGTGCGFGECCWFGYDEEFSLNCVNCGRARIVDVVCAFSCLTKRINLGMMREIYRSASL